MEAGRWTLCHDTGRQAKEVKLLYLLFDQLGDFSLIGKSSSFNILFGIDQLAVTFYIEDTAAALDQFNSCIRIMRPQFRFHPGSLRKKVSSTTILNKNIHNALLWYM